MDEEIINDILTTVHHLGDEVEKVKMAKKMQEYQEKIKKSDDLDVKWIEKHINIYWEMISVSESTTNQMIGEYSKYVDWKILSKHRKFDEGFLCKWKDKIYWGELEDNVVMSESFIEKFKDYIHWDNISAHQKLSEKFIKKWENKLDLERVVENQKLSINYIKENYKKLKFYNLETHQKLTKEFILKNLDELDIKKILEHQKVDFELYLKILDKCENPIKLNDLMRIYSATQEIPEEVLEKGISENLEYFLPKKYKDIWKNREVNVGYKSIANSMRTEKVIYFSQLFKNESIPINFLLKHKEKMSGSNWWFLFIRRDMTERIAIKYYEKMDDENIKFFLKNMDYGGRFISKNIKHIKELNMRFFEENKNLNDNSKKIIRSLKKLEIFK